MTNTPSSTGSQPPTSPATSDAMHPALARGRVAVITGASSGIGRAAAKRFAQLGMRVCLADIDADALNEAAADVAAVALRGVPDVLAVHTDVSRLEHVQKLKEAVYRRFGEVAVLMNNAGTGGGGGPWSDLDGWHRVLGVNMWGVIHGVQVFAEAMIGQGTPAAIVNTGSKQGLTNPPGDTAYNVSKAAIRTLTEGLAHKLRSTPGCQVTAHLLVPGYTFTGLTGRHVETKPDAAWWPSQVVDELVARMASNDFYVICPDNDVTREMDRRRLQWNTDDVLQNRPALSRWHPDHAADFAAWMAKD